MPHKSPLILRTLALQALSTLGLVALAPTASAQRFMVPHNRPGARIALVDATIGALIDGGWINVQATGSPSPGNSQLLDVERVGDEVWIASPFYVYRYGARAPRPFIDSFRIDAPVRGLETQALPGGATRVLVTTSDSIRLVSVDGNEYGELPITGGGDTLQLRGDSMLVAIQDMNRVDRYTLSGQRIGTFAGPSVPTSFGVLSKPKQLARRMNGNVLIAGDVRICEFTENGAFVGEYDAGPFEGGVAESKHERLVVPFGGGVALYDTRTEISLGVNAGFFGEGRKIGRFDGGSRLVIQPGEGSSEEICRGAVHSGGIAARLGFAGSTWVQDRSLAAFVENVPPHSFTMLMLSNEPADSVVAVADFGTLCIDRSAPTFRSIAGQSNAEGFVLFPLLDGSAQMPGVDAGSTWYSQSLYRDGTQPRLSSAVRFTLPR